MTEGWADIRSRLLHYFRDETVEFYGPDFATKHSAEAFVSLCGIVIHKSANFLDHPYFVDGSSDEKCRTCARILKKGKP